MVQDKGSIQISRKNSWNFSGKAWEISEFEALVLDSLSKGCLMIQSYSFGRMVIDGITYTADLIILPDKGIIENWYRKAGHVLAPPDLKKVVSADPKIIVAGTGAYGKMVPAPELESWLEQQKVELSVMDTPRAVDHFNRLVADSPEKKTAACFHLTC